MKVTGIVAEYNPFHNGHLYHLSKAREETNADYIVVVLSGDFVQRGSPAIIDKYSRTQTALMAGADLVLELPVYYATSSADYYAKGATALLDRLGVIDCLSFGSEHGKIEDLVGIAALSSHETPAYSVALNQYMVEGKSFAYAHTHALMDSCKDPVLASKIEQITKMPNNSLGIAYIKCLLQRKSSITPHTIYRTGADYNDSSEGVFSATSVRSELMRTRDVRSLCAQVPDFVMAEFNKNYKKTFPITRNDFSSILLYKLRHLQFFDEMAISKTPYKAPEITAFLDVTKGLSNRITASMNQYENYKQFADLLKTKNYTYASISRALTHLMLDIKKDRMDEFVAEDYVGYARILGFNKESTALLSAIKQNGDIPLISKLKDASSYLDATSLKMLRSDVFASDLYEQVASQKFHHPFRSEYTQEIIRI